MKHINKHTLALLIAVAVGTTATHLITAITPYYAIRSQGVNAPRHAVGTTPMLYAPLTMRKTKSILTEIDESHQEISPSTSGLLGITFEYMRSFDYKKINESLFGTNIFDCNAIKISGSKVANRGERDWLADYFYLPNDFESVVRFKPVIDNFIVDFNFYLDLDKWVKNSYFSIWSPLVHSRWHMNMHEVVTNYGVNPQVAGLFTPQTLQRGSMLENFTAYANGTELTPVAAAKPTRRTDVALEPVPITSNFFPLTIFQQLKNAKISTNEKSTTRFADVRAYLGWNIIQDKYHVGFNIQGAMPTGSRPRGKFLFEPIVGNGNHWELGGCVNAHCNLWSNADETAAVTLYGEINGTYFFHARQFRTFDLKCKPFSRYMLAQRMDTPVLNNLGGLPQDAQTPIYATSQFQQQFAPLANITTIPVDVGVNLQTDMFIMAHAQWHNWTFDLGYNIWTRSCENIRELGFNTLDKNMVWALKGDAQMFGFATMDANNTTTVNDIFANQPIALSATQSGATIYSGLNLESPTTNPNIDSPLLATVQSGPPLNPVAGTTPDPLLVNLSAVTPATNPPLINTSIQPIFIKETDLDICGAQTRGFSNTIFAHINYTGSDLHRWTPHIGLGGQIEVGRTNRDCDNGCQECAVSQWGVWVKTGFAFN